MTLLRQLQEVGVRPENLMHLSDQEIIRIEKMLRARSRINQEIDINEVEGIMEIIRHHGNELQLLFTSGFEGIRNIIENPGKAHVFSVGSMPLAGDNDKFSEFLDRYFGEDLNQYITNCLGKNHYNALYALLHYKACLTPQLQETIATHLTQKLVYLTECVRIKAGNLEEKINTGCNPYFYRCLSELGSVRFERMVSRFLNVVVDHLDKRKLKFRTLYAMRSFKAIGNNMQEVLKQNGETAEAQGVREITYGNGPQGKGGTFYPGNLIPGRDKKSSEGGWHRIGIAALVIYIIFRILAIGVFSNSSRNQYDLDTGLEQLKERLNGSGAEEEVADLVPDVDLFVSQMNALHRPDLEILERRSIPFVLDSLRLNEKNKWAILASENIGLKNQTNRAMLIHVGSANWNKFVTLAPKEETSIPGSVRTLRFYAGSNPQLITYVNDSGEVATAFRFATFSRSDQGLLNQDYPLNQIFFPQMDYEISILPNNGRVKLRIKEYQ